ncbi:MAG: hypothetical protein PHG77_12280, partial [Proteiniphilum sp.]|nr:hypothetical protein [Proteiniphilum sp.]
VSNPQNTHCPERSPFSVSMFLAEHNNFDSVSMLISMQNNNNRIAFLDFLEKTYFYWEPPTILEACTRF